MTRPHETEAVRLRIHVSEPFDFERENESPDLYGITIDHHDEDAEEWVVALEAGFVFNEEEYDAVLITPRYVGERLDRVFESILGVPVRIAHRTPEGWHFAMAGMISLAPASPGDAGNKFPKEDLI